MKKNLLGKKVKFAMLFAIASVGGLQASEAAGRSGYKINCPDLTDAGSHAHWDSQNERVTAVTDGAHGQIKLAGRSRNPGDFSNSELLTAGLMHTAYYIFSCVYLFNGNRNDSMVLSTTSDYYPELSKCSHVGGEKKYIECHY